MDLIDKDNLTFKENKPLIYVKLIGLNKSRKMKIKPKIIVEYEEEQKV